MFASIIPFLHSIGSQPLLYSVDDALTDQLDVGQIVEIPYGNNSENGIVTALYVDSPIDTESETFSRIKNIERIIATKKILAPYQIEMICSISERYMIPIHRVLAIFLTRPILSRLEKKNYQQIEENEVLPEIKKNGTIQLFQDDIVRPEYLETIIQGFLLSLFSLMTSR